MRLGGKWGYITPNGESAIPNQFVCQRGVAEFFREGLARVAKNGRWGYINRTGEFVIEPQFDMALEFSEGLGTVELNRRQGYVDHAGKLVIPT